MLWAISHRADKEVRPLADRHYNRQKVGSPQFVPPGRCLVLKTEGVCAFWVTSWPYAQFVKHAWAGAFVCSAFRNEGKHLSSRLIRHALACTRWKYPEIPELGMVTFVDICETRLKTHPGYCYRKAGFKEVGATKGGLVALQLLAEDFPEPEPPRGAV